MITNELRGYALGHKTLVNHKLLEIADRIDEEHDKAVVDAYLEGTSCEVNTDAWERLPVDIDDVPVHMRDKMVFINPDESVSEPFVVEGFESLDMWLVYYEDSHRFVVNPAHTRHYHEPTVEDVLREFASRWDDPTHYAKGELVEEYAAKLRLVGEDE